MAKCIFDECARERPRNHFTVGIRDDVTNTSLDYDESFSTEDPDTVRAVFRELMSGSRALQKILKVAYLGPEYSYSYQAAVERFGQKVDLIKVGSIADRREGKCRTSSSRHKTN